MNLLHDNFMTLVYAHLGTVVPAFVLGTALLLMQKGTDVHRLFGKIYMVLMLTTAIISLGIKSQVGPSWLNHFGFIHLLSLLVLYSVPVAYFAARRGDILRHQISMISLYVGGLLIAGGFTLAPGRLLHEWLF